MDELLPPVTGDAFILEGRTRRFGPKQWLFLGVALVGLFLLGTFVAWAIGLTTQLPLPKDTVILTLSGRSSTLPAELAGPSHSLLLPRIAGYIRDEHDELRSFAYIPRWQRVPTGYRSLTTHRLWRLVATHDLSPSDQTFTPFSLPLVKATWFSEGMVRITLPISIGSVSTVTFFKEDSLWKSDLPFSRGTELATSREGISFFLTNHPSLQEALLPLLGIPTVKEPIASLYQSWNKDVLEIQFEHPVSSSTIASLLPLTGRGIIETRDLLDGTVARVLRYPTIVPDLPYIATSTNGQSVLLTDRSFRLGEVTSSSILTPSCESFTAVASFSPIPSSFPFLTGRALFIGSVNEHLALCVIDTTVDK